MSEPLDLAEQLEDAKTALARAQVALAEDRQADAGATARLNALRARVAAGDVAITPEQLDAARVEAEHRALAREARLPPVAAAQEALFRAEQAVLNAEVAERWPALKRAVEDAWQAIERDLAGLAAADDALRAYRRSIEARANPAHNPQIRNGLGLSLGVGKIAGQRLDVDQVSDRLAAITNKALSSLTRQLR